MVPDRPFQTHPPRRGAVEVQEQRAWVGFYKRVGRDPALAAEVMAQLDSDAEMKRRHLALYLSCKQAVRGHKARQARNKRVGQWLRLLARTTLLRPLAFAGRAAHRAFHRSADVLAEAVATGRPPDTAPEKRTSRPATVAAREPAEPQVRNLLRDAEFANAHARFQQQAGTSPAASSENGSDPLDESAAPAVPVSRR